MQGEKTVLKDMFGYHVMVENEVRFDGVLCFPPLFAVLFLKHCVYPVCETSRVRQWDAFFYAALSHVAVQQFALEKLGCTPRVTCNYWKQVIHSRVHSAGNV